METPLVIAVSGLPATGKTSLSRQIGQRLGLPVWSKDALKEQLWESLGPDACSKGQLGRASVALLFHALETCLQAGQGAVVESTFRPSWDTPVFHQLQTRYDCRLQEVHCTCDEAVRRERFRLRVARGERHPCHPDEAIVAQGNDIHAFATGDDAIGPLGFATTPLVLDTTRFDTIDVQALCALLLPATSIRNH